MGMSESYDPKGYWEHRLSQYYGPRAVGNLSSSESYNAWLYRSKRRCLNGVFEDFDLHGKRVLDVGCGTGYFVNWFLRRGARVCGIDITEFSVRALKARFAAEFHVADVSSQDADLRGRHDVVNAWDVMYHIVDEAAFERALKNIARSVASGGLLLVTDRFGAAGDEQVAAHVRLRCLRTYQRILSARGFDLLELRFLYRWMNRRVLAPAIDDRLGGLYFWLDGHYAKPASGNLSLAVWRCQG